MKKVIVDAAKKYDVLIGQKLLADCASMIRSATGCNVAAIITDDRVDELYAKAVQDSFDHENIPYYKFVFKNGEASKNIKVYAEILEFLASKRLTRSDVVVALGGGVVGDMAGFAAATYLRGIRLVQIPTTFLAAIDSSVGGKTAVDLEAGKNLAGAFYQPDLVICDTDTLQSLTPEIFADGVAEAIKYGILASPRLFESFEDLSYKYKLESVICECVSVKARIVNLDEFDTGERKFLNLGHTIGHAVEKCSNYSISHGHAVAIGMAAIARTTYKMNLCERQTVERIISVLEKNFLPTELSFEQKELTNAALADKKRVGNKLSLVLPKQIGKCTLWDINVDELYQMIGMGKEL